MKFGIYKELMSPSSYFKSRPDLLTLGRAGGGNRNLGKPYKCRRYVIDVIGLDPLSLEDLGGGFNAFAS